ncbi:MAG: GLPGLI family protein [Flavobacteriaceae bacterium]
MKHFFTVFCYFLFFFFAKAQTSGTITYELKIEEQSYPVQNEFSKKISEDAKKLEFILDFNNKESLFYCADAIDNDSNLALAVSGASEPIYYNFSEKIFLKNNYLTIYTNEKEFLLKDKVNLKWNITEESKEISGYLCYKATTKIKKNTSKGKVEEIVEVWFCPDFPVNIFPKSYVGLPGIIFEVREKFCVFGLKKIHFNTNPKIPKPLKGKEITEDEYHNIVMERKIEFDKKFKGKK